MGLTERHWFEDEEPKLTEYQLQDSIRELDEAYKKGYAACHEKEVPKWISVKDRMPDENQDVLIYGYWTGTSGRTYKETWLACMKEFVYQGNVPIAWMPLPQPPKEEK